MAKVSKNDFDQTAWRIGGSLMLSESKTDAGSEFQGTWFSHHFMADVWVLQTGKPEHDWTVLITVVDGRMVRRSWRRAWDRRTIPSLCRQFEADLLGEEPHP